VKLSYRILDRLFTLRLATSKGLVTISCYDTEQFDKDGKRYVGAPHHRVTYRVTLNGKVVWKLGATYAAIAPHQSIDGKHAKSHAIAMFDSAWDEDLTDEQREFISSVGEELAMHREERYGE